MRAAELAATLNGRRCGRGWIACCPAHDDREPSLSIGEASDGRLLLRCFAGCTWSEICEALGKRSLRPRQPDVHVPGRCSSAPRGHHLEDAQLELIRSAWRRAVPVAGTPAERYLRGRSITITIPATLRYAKLRHLESGLWLPCMLAAVQDCHGRLTGLHRTYLAPDGDGKTPLEPVKKMLGACRGGAVRLAAGRRLALCEGIETGLSIRQACPDLPVWCALSAGNLDWLTLPPETEEVVLVADGDPVGLAAAFRAAQRYGTTRRVKLVELPSGMDASDMLRHEAAAA